MSGASHRWRLVATAASAGLVGFVLGWFLSVGRRKDAPEDEPQRSSSLKEPPQKPTSATCGPSHSVSRVSRKIYGLGGYSRQNKVLLCLVGLPARGKSYITKMLTRYLVWSGFAVKVFNAGNLRRAKGNAGASADFFTDHPDAVSAREFIASETMNEAMRWLEEQTEVSVGIFDATNTTQKRRRAIYEQCLSKDGISPIFVESICDDPQILAANYSMKLQNDDYRDQDPKKAHEDFLARVVNYEKRYETITDDELDGQISYIKLFNVGQKLTVRNIDGFVPSKIGFYLSNVHIQPRKILLTRHAETEDQIRGVLGSIGDQLTPNGGQYSHRLAAYLGRARAAVRLSVFDEDLKVSGKSIDPSWHLDIDPGDVLTVSSTSASASIRLGNETEERVAYQLTASCPGMRISPVSGFLQVGEAVGVIVFYEGREPKVADGNHILIASTTASSPLSEEQWALAPKQERRLDVQLEDPSFVKVRQETSPKRTRRRCSSDISSGSGDDLIVLMGTSPVHRATLEALSGFEDISNAPVMVTSLLNELDGGDYNGLTRERIREEFPHVWAQREQDKLNFRYPGAGGESYVDVIGRLQPIIIELERQRRSVLIISGLAVQRCIYAYFAGCIREEVSYLDLKMHTVYELEPLPHGTEVTEHNLGP